ncbi:MAG: hypothetical protein KAI18_04510, partial [Candidatus Aenigmarchaeota archaeon]|nr:hypothetical protein [Candidatus Aenigmarchaeota archaeon]
SGLFGRKVDGFANIVISPIASSGMYSLSLDFDCFDIHTATDRDKTKLLGCIFYDGYNLDDSVNLKNPVYVGSRDEIFLSSPKDYLKKFDDFLDSVDYGISQVLPYSYEFIVVDNDDFNFEYKSLLNIKYNPSDGLTGVQVKMVLMDDFSVLLDTSKDIDIILEGN